MFLYKRYLTFDISAQKNLFPIFNQISKSPWDFGDSDVDCYGENFSLETFRKWNDIVPKYIEGPKML